MYSIHLVEVIAAIMATRTTRMRPLDNNKQLEILRVVDELDAKNNDEGGVGGRELEQSIEALEKQRDEVLSPLSSLCSLHLALSTLLCAV